jgi:hypothetical protein
MKQISYIIREMIEARISESAAITNNEALKIGKLAKKEAENIRKVGGKLSEMDSAHLDNLAKFAFDRNVKLIRSSMTERGETDNREDSFRIVAAVIGKDRATALVKGNY